MMSEKTIEEKSNFKVFNGLQKTFSHYSKECQCTMTFAIYLPKQSETKKCPVIYYLSGLTCTEQNVITKSGFQNDASKLGLIVVCPDTSPRGEDVPDIVDEYDMGKGAGFYVDATKEPWKKNYRMYSYVSQELPNLIEELFPVVIGRRGIMGHSMGGHGALIIALNNIDIYPCVSAFAPICHPSQCGWGMKAFRNYLGEDNKQVWEKYDAVELIRQGKWKKWQIGGEREGRRILIDQGSNDNFLHQSQLLPDQLKQVCDGAVLELRMQEGYDHSYYFISTFIGEHLKFQADILKSGSCQSSGE